MTVRILHMLPDLAVGGGQQLVLRNTACMDRSQFDNYVCYVRSKNEMVPQFVAAGIPTFSLAVPRRQQAIACRLPFAFLEVLSFVRTRQVDIIHTNNTVWDRRFGQFAAKLLSVPVVNTLHTMIIGHPESVRARVYRRFTKGSIRRVVAVSESVREAWMPFLHEEGVAERNVLVVPPGLDLSLYPTSLDIEASHRLRKTIGLGNASPLLVNVARLHESKGQHLLIPLMRKVVNCWPRARLLIIGDGPERMKLERLIRQAGLESVIYLLGHRDDVPSLMALSDLFIFPSLSEGFGLVVLEAMAACKPVLAFSLAPLREFVEHGQSGILVEQVNLSDLTRATLKLMANPGKWHEMGQRGRQIVEDRFRLEDSVRAIEEVYLSVLDE
jgi:glycosyltransferase involved in cell wall biosynthesis